MELKEMHEAIPFSPITRLSQNIGATDTIIFVDNVSAFPPGPGLATIGIDEDAETIRYSALTENALSGCMRGIEGTAKDWPLGENIARYFTAKDWNDIKENVELLHKESQKAYCTHAWNGTVLTITTQSGSSSVDLQGEKGDSPIRGVDYWTEADKAEMIQLFIDAMNGTIYGAVDADNTIILTGIIPDGTYSVKYEMENGTIIDIGDMVKDSNVYYSITNNLTNCTNGNRTIKVLEGDDYSATISANSGYTLSSVVVTMGGTDITSSAVSGGNINIAEVTGDIVITAVAEKIEIVNQIPISTDASGNLYVGTNGEKGYKTDYRIGVGTGEEKAQTGCCVSGFIPCTGHQTVRIKNITLNSNIGYNGLCFYDSSKAILHGVSLNDEVIDVSDDGVYSFMPGEFNTVSENCSYIRFSCGVISSDTILTVDQEIV